MFGVHLLLGLAIFAITLKFFAGREPFRSYPTWMKVNLVLLFATVAVASGLKWGRERAVARRAAATAAAAVPRVEGSPASRP